MLLGQLKAQHYETTKRLDRFESHLDDIGNKIDALQKFKWQVMGACLLFTTVLSIIFK